MDKLRHSFLLELNKFWVYTYALTTLIFYVFLTIKLFMEIKQLKVSFGHFAALICHFWVWDWCLKQLQVLLMYIYEFPFLCFAHNQFLRGVLANVENFYRRTDRPTDEPTDRWTQWNIEAPCRSFKKLMELSTKGGGGGGVRIGQFSTKKNNCLKHSKWPKKHFKTNLFFSIFRGGGGSFHQNWIAQLQNSLTRPSCNYSRTRIIQNSFHDM